MKNQFAASISLILTFCASQGAHAQAPAPPAKLEFDIISIHQNKSGVPWNAGDKQTMNVPYGPDDNYVETHGTLSAKNYPLLNLIVFAYKVPTAQGEALIHSLPDWAVTDGFDIEARTEDRNVSKDDMRLMMRSLLADRFHLVIHTETRQVSEYVAELIKPGKLGPQIQPHPADQPCSPVYVQPKNGGPPVPPPDPHLFASNFPLRCGTYGPAPVAAPYLKGEGSRNISMTMIVNTFTGLGQLGRPVVDQTGLTGNYDWYISFLPEYPPGAQLPPDMSGPSFVEAIKAQLGIKLVPQKGPYDYLIVDHVQHPTEN
jgi:uncharacterized protein (TIGR03435 family)